ncbi:MAG: hypothetical protein IT365_01760 [Candidatus Hydrogenedentes bacterium]|nr:hypothetical protein [Candidatus Hydrogenedentota bacterium]
MLKWKQGKQPTKVHAPRGSALAALFLFAVLAFAAARAMAENQFAIVETETLTTAREAVRVCLHCFSLDDALAPPDTVSLPGERIRGSIMLDPQGKAVALGTHAGHAGRGGVGESFLSALSTNPMALGAEGWVVSEPGWQFVAGRLMRGRDGGLVAVSALAALSSREASAGRLEARDMADVIPYALSSNAARWLLPGSPVAMTNVSEIPAVMVLCRDPSGNPVLHVRDVTRGEVLREALALLAPGRRLAPVALKESGDGNYLLALSTGSASDPANARDASWLHVVRLSDMAVAGGALEIRGVPVDDINPLYAAGSNRFWVATREPGLRFAYLTEVNAGREGARKIAEYSFSGVTAPLRIAADAKDAGLLVGIGKRLEIWSDGKPGGSSLTFDAPIGAVAFADGRLFVGEGSHLHVLSRDTLETQRVVQLQSGHIAGIRVLTTSAQPDPSSMADPGGSEIGDALDPEWERPSPTLHLQPFVRFRGESAGRQFRAIQLKNPFPDAMRWSLEFNRSKLPWLSAYPMRGELPGWFLMGVEPRHYMQGQSDSGHVTLHVRRESDGKEAAGSPYRIGVRVSPARPTVSRILWLLGGTPESPHPRDAADPLRLKGLMDLLAGPANHFSHTVCRGPLSESLEDFPIVVLNLPAVAAGTVARQALLDYVASGGGLLLLGSHEGPAFSESYARWLKPAGLVLDTATGVSGAYASASLNPVSRHCDSLSLSNGAVLMVEDPFEILVPVTDMPGVAALAIRQYGTGRIAALAALTPLETPALNKQSNRQFATDVFQWLAMAGMDSQDVDGDGLADDMEDRNSNGAVDPGETDRLNPDSDGDGIPDGAEDLNRNGNVDGGETSPLDPDTDGDGIYDGADSSPVPL